MSDARCRTCLHWHPPPEGGTLGACHRRAPAPLLLPLLPVATYGSPAVVWPPTAPDCSCGAWCPQPGRPQVGAAAALREAADAVEAKPVSGMELDPHGYGGGYFQACQEVVDLLRKRARVLEGEG